MHLNDNRKFGGAGKGTVVKDMNRSDYKQYSDTTQYTSCFHTQITFQSRGWPDTSIGRTKISTTISVQVWRQLQAKFYGTPVHGQRLTASSVCSKPGLAQNFRQRVFRLSYVLGDVGLGSPFSVSIRRFAA